jgi:hypothetical protein
MLRWFALCCCCNSHHTALLLHCIAILLNPDFTHSLSHSLLHLLTFFYLSSFHYFSFSFFSEFSIFIIYKTKTISFLYLNYYYFY